MKRIITGSDAKLIDNITINEIGIPGIVLMERAALSIYNEIKGGYLNYLVICGSGNNGADGIAIARMLYQGGENVTIILMSEKVGTDEYQKQLSIAANLGVDIFAYEEFIQEEIDLDEFDCIVDAMFGIGLDRNITGKYEEVIKRINESDSDVIAVDIPSGVSADDGRILGTCVNADLTVTFGYVKVGQIAYPGKDYIGHLQVKDIGFYKGALNQLEKEIYALDGEDLRYIPDRFDRSNKGSYGRLLIIAGSKDMSGAAYLSGKAAYRMGVGLVNIMTVKEVADRISIALPEAVYTTIDEEIINQNLSEEESANNKILNTIKEYDNIVIGPGLGKSDETLWLIEKVLEKKTKTIIDADALNLIVEHRELINKLHGKCIITPHMAEMSRLTKRDIKDIIDNPYKAAVKVAESAGVTCLLKDAHTIIATNEGKVFINLTGNNGMSTAGSGDVLSGILGALMALGTNFDYVAGLGAYIHGACGDLCAEHNGQASMMAGDMIEEIKNII